jgi:hypothetical protein
LEKEVLDTFDYTTQAELFEAGADAESFSTRGRNFRRQPLGYTRFARAADAIRFAIEELPPQDLISAYQIDGLRCEATEIRRLYESAGYPLARRVAGPPR